MLGPNEELLSSSIAAIVECLVERTSFFFLFQDHLVHVMFHIIFKNKTFEL